MCLRAVEVNEVVHDVVIITHVEILEFGFNFAFRVVQTEVVLQLHNKVRLLIELWQTFAGGQQQFKPIQHNSFKIRLL